LSNPQIWDRCLKKLATQISDDDINTWLSPLHCHLRGGTLKLLAPNRYVLNYVRSNLLEYINDIALSSDSSINEVEIEIGSYGLEARNSSSTNTDNQLSWILRPPI